MPTSLALQKKPGDLLLQFSTVWVDLFICHTQIVSQHGDAKYCILKRIGYAGLYVDLVQESWALKAQLSMQC